MRDTKLIEPGKWHIEYNEAGERIAHLPHVSCLMIKELVRGALDHIHGEVDYSFYNTLHEG